LGPEKIEFQKDQQTTIHGTRIFTHGVLVRSAPLNQPGHSPASAQISPLCDPSEKYFWNRETFPDIEVTERGTPADEDSVASRRNADFRDFSEFPIALRWTQLRCQYSGTGLRR
jgi:hypothetical protein